MDFELNLTPAYDAGLSMDAWNLLAWCVHQYGKEGYVAPVEDTEALQELVKAGLVRKFGKSVKISQEVVKPLGK